MPRCKSICYLGTDTAYCGNREGNLLRCVYPFNIHYLSDTKKVLCDGYTVLYCKSCIIVSKLKMCSACNVYVKHTVDVIEICSLRKWICIKCLNNSPFSDDITYDTIQDAGAIIITYHELVKQMQNDQKRYLLNLYYFTVNDVWKRKLAIIQLIDSISDDTAKRISYDMQGDDLSILCNLLDI
jgi:hypothetical protein